MNVNLIKTSVAITSYMDDTMDLSDQLYESDEEIVKKMNNLIVNNKSLEARMTDAEMTLSIKNKKL